jgi:hypothetical protein
LSDQITPKRRCVGRQLLYLERAAGAGAVGALRGNWLLNDRREDAWSSRGGGDRCGRSAVNPTETSLRLTDRPSKLIHNSECNFSERALGYIIAADRSLSLSLSLSGREKLFSLALGRRRTSHSHITCFTALTSGQSAILPSTPLQAMNYNGCFFTNMNSKVLNLNCFDIFFPSQPSMHHLYHSVFFTVGFCMHVY